MTGFYCSITGSTSTKKLAAPKDPAGCINEPALCTSGAKRPLYVYNTPNNGAWLRVSCQQPCDERALMQFGARRSCLARER